MRPGLEEGDLVLVDRMSGEFGTPEVGDVVLVRRPDDRARELLVRVVAQEGDSVAVDDAEIRVTDDPIVLSAPGRRWRAAEPSHLGALAAIDGPITRTARLPSGTEHRVITRSDALHSGALRTVHEIPKGHVFVLGDNRDAAYDSRAFGPIPMADVVGEVRLVVRASEPDGGLIGRWIRFLD